MLRELLHLIRHGPDPKRDAVIYLNYTDKSFFPRIRENRSSTPDPPVAWRPEFLVTRGKREEPVDEVAEERKALEHAEGSEKNIISLHLQFRQFLHFVPQTRGVTKKGSSHIGF
jgi:hypothetical protein